jgi:anthranilate phosphoribosyltransferase
MSPWRIYEKTWWILFKALDDQERLDAFALMWEKWPEQMQIGALVAANRIPEKCEKTT